MTRSRSARHALSALAVSAVAVLCTCAPALAAPPEPPSEVTVQSPVKATEATFHGFLNPAAPEPVKPGTYEFLYKKSSTECAGEGKAPASPAISLGGIHEEVSETLTGLKASTAYTVCLLARNGTAGEETVGPPVTFTTATPPEKPETTTPAVSITATSAELQGKLNPGKEATVGWHFAYSKSGACTSESTTAQETEITGKAVSEHVAVSELQPNAEYKFCLVATNAAEESIAGNEVSLKTLPLAPVISGEFAASVNTSSATLEAAVNPNNEATNYAFEYSTTEAAGKLTGTVVKVNGASPLEGFGAQTASVPTGSVLAPGTTYFYRVVAENAQSKIEGKPAEGAVASVTTVPTPFTDAATAVTTTFAELHGHLTPLNEKVATQYRFDYNLGPACNGGTVTSPVEAGKAPPTEVAASVGVGSLQPNAEYTVCFVTSNVSGSAQGPPVHFITLAVPPTIVRVGSSSSSTTGVTLEAVVNPNNQATTFSFEYATSEATLLKGEGTKGATGPLAPGFKGLPVNDVLTGLTPDTTYYFRVTAENTKAEKTEAFGRASTQGAPLVGTEAAQNVTSLSATLAGTVDPGGLPSTYRFLYVAAAEYEPLAPEPYAKGGSSESYSVGPDFTVHPVLYPAELKPGETYDYTIVATNGLGAVAGSNQVVVTPALPAPPPGAGESGTPAPAPFPAGVLPAFIPYQTIAQLEAREPKGSSTGPPAKLTKRQLLAKALKACGKKPKRKRAACRQAAKRKYR